MPGRIEKKKLAFRCYHADCANEPPTEILVEVPQGVVLSGREREITRYCGRNHANQLTVPAEWDNHNAILGPDPVGSPGAGRDDAGIIGHLPDRTRIVQGRRP